MISALAITYNEEENIERYINSLSFADEVIIVDAYSTDNTKRLAKKFNVKFVQRTFDDFSSQRNYAISLAKYKWVTFFDLDEIILPDLAVELKQKAELNNNIAAYKVKRRFYFMRKLIKYSGFQNDNVARLFDKTKCKYNGKLVHESLEINGLTKNLKHKCDHLSYKSYDIYNQKLTKYSEFQAEMLFKKNLRPNLYHFLIRPSYRFFHQYFIKIGFLDGKEGFILAYLSAFAVFKRYIQLWTKYRDIA